MQPSHTLLPVSAALPASHSVGFDAPRPHALPPGQGVQSYGLCSEALAPQVPKPHGIGEALPCGQYEPTEHGVGAIVATPHELPAGQAPTHEPRDCAATSRLSPTVPATASVVREGRQRAVHTVGTRENENEPAGQAKG